MCRREDRVISASNTPYLKRKIREEVAAFIEMPLG